ncbi:uncharacterized protein LODBEIA_P33620 [Lodderomyces beijingensis]|uniref:Uncharacterized protein n=1 Tax=Lodderomyces beijingensis TaxID=1775926 RepID=A0ABP0ZN83_9ASCO
MIGLRQSTNLRLCRLSSQRAWLVTAQRLNSTTSTNKPKPKPKKKPKAMNIARVPISYIGVMTDHYTPPKLRSVPLKSWPRVILNRFLVFGFNTYNVLKYKREISKPLKFNEWKDKAIEHYVRTNKAFAQACTKAASPLEGGPYGGPQGVANFLASKLDQVGGKHLIDALSARASTFASQQNMQVEWKLVSIDKNPKITTFSAIPDEDGIATYVQFVMNLKTTQQISVKNTSTGEVVQESQTNADDYLVYSMNPWDERILLVGKIFESEPDRGLKSDMDAFDTRTMQNFINEAGDIYRDKPASAVEKV